MQKGRATADIALKIPALHEGAKAVLSQMKQINVICAHRGWRKTSMKIRRELTWGSDNWHVYSFAPNMTHVRVAWALMAKSMGQQVFDANLHKSEQTVFLPGKGAIHYFSMEDPSTAAGNTGGKITVDEMGSMIDGRYQSIIEPTFIKGVMEFGYDNCTMDIYGTPNREGNPYNDFYDLLQFALSGKDPRWAGFHIPVAAKVVDGELVPDYSPYALPIPFEVLKQSYDNSARKREWEIEYLCAFLSDEGAQFHGVEKCCVLDYEEDHLGRCRLKGYIPNKRGWYQHGIDIGLSRDYFVICTIDRNTNQQVYMHRCLPGSFQNIYEAIKVAYRMYPGQMFLDATGGGMHVPEEMARRGVAVTGVQFNQINKAPTMDNLASLIENNTIRLFNHPVLKKELILMDRKPMEAGGYKIKGPKGGHDDVPISLALMTRGVVGIVQSTDADFSVLDAFREANPPLPIFSEPMY